MAPKKQKKRLGKKHRSAATRPKLGRAVPKLKGAVKEVSPKKRKELAAKKAAAIAKSKTPTRSPENERRRVIGEESMRPVEGEARRERASAGGTQIPSGNDRKKSKSSVAGGAGSAHEERDWKQAEAIASELTLATDIGHRETTRLPLVAICGRPNVGKSTLFNKLTQTRRSIVGDEPGITRDRIYGEVEWAGRDVRLVDTGGVIPDDEALIPAEIFRQAKVGLEEADARCESSIRAVWCPMMRR